MSIAVKCGNAGDVLARENGSLPERSALDVISFPSLLVRGAGTVMSECLFLTPSNSFFPRLFCPPK